MFKVVAYQNDAHVSNIITTSQKENVINEIIGFLAIE